MSIESFAVNGTPCSGPMSPPAMTAASAAFAADSAPSATVTMALTLGSTAAMRSRCACTTSTGETCRVRINAASWVASEKTMSCVVLWVMG